MIKRNKIKVKSQKINNMRFVSESFINKFNVVLKWQFWTLNDYNKNEDKFTEDKKYAYRVRIIYQQIQCAFEMTN